MRRDRVCLLALGILAVLLLPVAASGQASPDSVSAFPHAVPVPFGPGERLGYKVKLGIFSVGEGHMTVMGVDTVRGFPSYHVSLGIKGGIPFARVDDEFQSWIDIHSLVSRRFIQDIHQVGSERFRHYEFFPEEWRYERVDIEEEGEMPTSLPLDDISFIYFIRSLPLVVGQEYRFNRYFKETGNPVVIRVVRKDTVEVPAGTFETIVVKPIIQTRGLFGKGGEAELHFTDDDRRLMVYLRSKVPLVGSITLHLREIQEGRPFRPFAISGDPPPPERGLRHSVAVGHPEMGHRVEDPAGEPHFHALADQRSTPHDLADDRPVPIGSVLGGARTSRRRGPRCPWSHFCGSETG